MRKLFYAFVMLLFIVITFTQCSKINNNIIAPVNSQGFEIDCEPKTVDINVESRLLQIEHSPKFSIDYSALKLEGIGLTSVKYYYPAPALNISVDTEFNIAESDSFTVQIRNCKNKNEWSVDLGNMNIDESNKWMNSEVTLLNKIKSYNPDSTVNYQFVFKALKKAKGYVCFIEKNQTGQVISNESHGLIIGYVINALSEIKLNIDEIKWVYNSGEGAGSSVSVKMNGTTNIYRLRGMTYGDGLSRAMEIPIRNNGSFEIELPVAFSHTEGITLTTNTKLLLYGTVGLPKIVQLKNPESSKL